MEAVAQIEETGTRLRLDHDRQFEGRSGDATLRIQGESPEGQRVMDATYVEVSAEEAKLLGWFLRAVRTPPGEIVQEVAQELQATFSSCLSGRDARQAADLSWKGITAAAKAKMGVGYSAERIDALAERFERAAGRSSAPAVTGGYEG